MSVNRDWKRIVDEVAAEFGGAVERTRSSHWRIRLPNGRFIITGQTPRTINPSRLRQDIRRELLKPPARGRHSNASGSDP